MAMNDTNHSSASSSGSGDYGAAAGAASAGPVVFQCRACRTIVGDSNVLVHSDPKLKTVTLHAVRQVVTTPQAQLSTSGVDIGSTFLPLNCTQCKNTIGRMYKTTSRALMSLCDLYTLDTELLIAYQCGFIGTAAAAAAAASSDSKSSVAGSARLDTASDYSEFSVHSLAETNKQLLRVVIDLDKRMRKLEAILPLLAATAATTALTAGAGSGAAPSAGAAATALPHASHKKK